MALTDNIVAYWKLDESSGNAADATGNGFTLVNTSAAYSAGIINNGADFTAGGSSSQLSINNNCGIDGGNITISAWFKVTTNDASTFYFLGCGSDVSQVLYYMRYKGATDATLSLGRWKVPASDINITGPVVTNNTWHHIVLTYDGVTLAGYFDNSAITGTATSGNGTAGLSTQTSLGRYSQLGNSSQSQVDETGIWSRVLSAGEVSTLYNGGVGLQYPFVAPPASTTTPSFLFNII